MDEDNWSWRNEPLTKGDMYDALLKSTDKLQRSVDQFTPYLKKVYWSKGFVALYELMNAQIIYVLREIAECVRDGRGPHE